MGMSVGSSGSDEPGIMAVINTTPLVDVMLVLLIIFLVTIPAALNIKKVVLPKVDNIPTQTKPENITIVIDPVGEVYWNAEHLRDRQHLLDRIKIEAVKTPQPELHIRADKETRYEAVGKVIYTIQRGGIVKVGFLSEPDHSTR